MKKSGKWLPSFYELLKTLDCLGIRMEEFFNYKIRNPKIKTRSSKEIRQFIKETHIIDDEYKGIVLGIMDDTKKFRIINKGT